MIMKLEHTYSGLVILNSQKKLGISIGGFDQKPIIS